MGVQYLLPCTCGKTTTVDSSQSGLRVACQCGQQLDVPTHLGLQRLERAVASVATSPGDAKASAGWGKRQGLLFLATVFVAAAAAVWLWAHNSMPSDPWVSWLDEAEPQDLFYYWPSLASSIDVSSSEIGQMAIKEAEKAKLWKIAAYLAAGVGLALGVCALLVGGGPSSPRAAGKK